MTEEMVFYISTSFGVVGCFWAIAFGQLLLGFICIVNIQNKEKDNLNLW
jgi:hypothetical protein